MGKDEAAKAYGNGEEGSGGSGWRARAVTVAGRPVRVIVIFAAVAALVLIGGAVGVYAYDRAHSDQIADGVKVGTVDVGGLDRDQAARRIQRRLVAPLHRPVFVKLGSERYRLPASHLKIHADVQGMVDEAIDESQSWGLPGRVFRDVTGGVVDQTVEPEISYSRAAVADFVRHVTKKIDREPQDASVAPTGDSLNVVPAENGRTLKQGKLQASLNTAIANGGRNKVVNAHVVIARPKVSTNEVASKYPTYLTLDRAGFTLRFWKDLKLTKSYTGGCRPSGAGDPGGRVRDPVQGGQPDLARPRVLLGRQPRRHRRAAGPFESDQGPLDGHLQRRRHPRHRRDLVDRAGGLARLRANDDSRRRGPLRPRRRRHAHLHRLTDAAKRRIRTPRRRFAGSATQAYAASWRM